MAERGSWAAGWVPIAENFPATLAKDAAPETLKDGQTTDSYGLGLDKPGYLYAASAPAGTVWNGVTAVTAPTYPPATATWRFAHNRLWGWASSGATLYYGAYGYDTYYFIQGLGYIPCDSQDAGNIVQVVPFGDNMAVFKATSLFVVKGASSPMGNFAGDYVEQAMGLPVAGNVVAIDGTLYWANADGIWSFNGRNLAELTGPIRDSLAPFVSTSIKTLRGDFTERRIIGRSASATEFVIELGETPGLYDYSTSGFRFTTRTLAGAEGDPLVIDKIGFTYKYETDELAKTGLQVKINDDWKTETDVKFQPAFSNGRHEVALNNVYACRRFAFRLTSASTGLYISRIMVHVKQGGVTGFSGK
jgi:hypothetical protein